MRYSTIYVLSGVLAALASAGPLSQSRDLESRELQPLVKRAPVPEPILLEDDEDDEEFDSYSLVQRADDKDADDKAGAADPADAAEGATAPAAAGDAAAKKPKPEKNGTAKAAGDKKNATAKAKKNATAKAKKNKTVKAAKTAKTAARDTLTPVSLRRFIVPRIEDEEDEYEHEYSV